MGRSGRRDGGKEGSRVTKDGKEGVIGGREGSTAGNFTSEVNEER